MVDVWLPYGSTEVCVRVPTENLQDIIEPHEKSASENPQTETENALMNPIGTKRLAELVRPENKIAMILKDSGIHINQLIVSSIVKELESAEINVRDLTVFIAYDPLQEGATKDEKTILDEQLLSRVKILRHNCETDENVMVGKTSRGTKVFLNKAFAEADVKILAGVIEPHPYAGYSGGREGVLPGVSNIETVQHNLSLALNPKAVRGSLEGNPVHEDMVEAAHLANVDFGLSIVRNSKSEVVKALAGDVDKSFDEGVKILNEMCLVPVEKRADLVFISPGSSHDASLFDACKIIDVALEATRRGGVIAVVAECAKGYGNEGFRQLASKFRDPDAIEKVLKKNFTIGGFMAYRLMKALHRTSVFLVSILPDYYASEVFGMKTARTANAVLPYALDKTGKKGKVSCIPNGNFVIPLVKTSETKGEE